MAGKAMTDLNKGYTRHIIAAAKSAGLLRNQLAYVLATSEWETNRTQQPVKEAYWLSEDWRRKNLRYFPWYGRGFVQLTWEENYRRADDKLGLGGDLASNPDLALAPGIAANIIVTGMREGWFTGKKLADYITLHKSDYVNARRIVNGTDKAHEIAALARAYDDALRAEGYGDDPTTPTPQGGLLTALLRLLTAIFGGRK